MLNFTNRLKLSRVSDIHCHLRPNVMARHQYGPTELRFYSRRDCRFFLISFWAVFDHASPLLQAIVSVYIWIPAAGE